MPENATKVLLALGLVLCLPAALSAKKPPGPPPGGGEAPSGDADDSSGFRRHFEQQGGNEDLESLEVARTQVFEFDGHTYRLFPAHDLPLTFDRIVVIGQIEAVLHL